MRRRKKSVKISFILIELIFNELISYELIMQKNGGKINFELFLQTADALEFGKNYCACVPTSH